MLCKTPPVVQSGVVLHSNLELFSIVGCEVQAFKGNCNFLARNGFFTHFAIASTILKHSMGDKTCVPAYVQNKYAI